MNIVGHKKQLNFLENILASQKNSQAYLFVGPESVGKFSIAKIFADSLSKGLRKVDQENLSKEIHNIDIDILEPEIIEKKSIIKYKNIEVDDLREA